MADEEDIEDNEDNDELGLDVESPYRDISLLRADSSKKNEKQDSSIHFTTYLKSEKVSDSSRRRPVDEEAFFSMQDRSGR